MTNFKVYSKTLSFSLVSFLVDLIGFAIFVGLAVAGFFIGGENALIGLLIGAVLGIIVAALINFFITTRFKAGQIAMMTRGVTEGKLPEHTFSAGMAEIKGRFAKLAAFVAITRAIKGIFHQISRAITGVATAVGGDTGNAVGNAIDGAVQTLLAYLCDCCLGWILYRKDVNAAKAGCEGCVIFFKHGKTLIRNVGRIFGMGLVSFLLIGGAFFGLSYVISIQFPDAFAALAAELAKLGSAENPTPEWLTVPSTLYLAFSAFCAIVLWSMFHGVLIRPFILVGVLRNYMAAGIKDMPTEKDFQVLDSKSPKFAALHKLVK